MYSLRPTAKFQKDLKRIRRQGCNISLLTDVLKILAAGEPLPVKYKDHNLTGNYKGCQECHITPDWLLIYEISANEELILYLTRARTHSDPF